MSEIIVDGLIEAKDRFSKEYNYKFTYTEILAKIIGKLLEKEENQYLNAVLEDNKIKIISPVNLGIAVSTNYGLVVPVVKDITSKSLLQISENLRELSDKAREMQLTLDDIEGGTFTLTNLGMFGIDSFTPIINPPQTGILGVGRIVKKPTYDELTSSIKISNTSWMSLTFDHRILDGAMASIFLKELSEVLLSYEEIKSFISF
ncbi:MAG: 2-oxo acid dehydrogenase subunit E2 [Caldisphaera sp.]|nr:MAG: 2-oxo acid dehydrogenase subunit E2 [Caldisphaera sp.]